MVTLSKETSVIIEFARSVQSRTEMKIVLKESSHSMKTRDNLLISAF